MKKVNKVQERVLKILFALANLLVAAGNFAAAYWLYTLGLAASMELWRFLALFPWAVGAYFSYLYFATLLGRLK